MSLAVGPLRVGVLVSHLLWPRAPLPVQLGLTWEVGALNHGSAPGSLPPRSLSCVHCTPSWGAPVPSQASLQRGSEPLNPHPTLGWIPLLATWRQHLLVLLPLSVWGFCPSRAPWLGLLSLGGQEIVRHLQRGSRVAVWNTGRNWCSSLRQVPGRVASPDNRECKTMFTCSTISTRKA